MWSISQSCVGERRPRSSNPMQHGTRERTIPRDGPDSSSEGQPGNRRSSELNRPERASKEMPRRPGTAGRTQAQGRIGQAKAETPEAATDSIVDQDLEAEGGVGNQAAWPSKTDPKGEVERGPGDLGEDIHLNSEEGRAGAWQSEIEESPRGHTRWSKAMAAETATREGKPSKGDHATRKTGRPRCATRRILGSESMETGGCRQPLRQNR